MFLRLIRYAADEETVLNEVSAATYIFMDDALCSGQYETFLEAVPDWLTENCQGVPAGFTCVWQSLKDGSRSTDPIMRISSGKIFIQERRSARSPEAGK